MLNVKGFFDYCVDEQCLEQKYEFTIKLLYEYGYRTIAINQTINANELDQKKKKKKGEPREGVSDFVPEPYKIVAVQGCEDITILNRLTIIFSSQDVIHKVVKSQNYKKYHIIAVLPTTPQAIMFVCSNFDGDIYCINPENRNNIKRSRKIFKQLMEKGYHFEISYGPAIEDTTKRKNIIHTSHVYHSLIKSRNIIISSGATSSRLIRGPYDVINIGFIFGLNEHQAKGAITHCGRNVYINSVGRRHGKAVVFVENIAKHELEKPKLMEGVNNFSENVISLCESDEEMEATQPASKKPKQ